MLGAVPASHAKTRPLAGPFRAVMSRGRSVRRRTQLPRQLGAAEVVGAGCQEVRRAISKKRLPRFLRALIVIASAFTMKIAVAATSAAVKL